MIPGRMPPGRNAYYEAMQKFAPILGAVLFMVIGLAFLINFIQERRNPQVEGERFDPVKNFSRLSARGMTEAYMKRSDE